MLTCYQNTLSFNWKTPDALVDQESFYRNKLSLHKITDAIKLPATFFLYHDMIEPFVLPHLETLRRQTPLYQNMLIISACLITHTKHKRVNKKPKLVFLLSKYKISLGLLKIYIGFQTIHSLSGWWNTKKVIFIYLHTKAPKHFLVFII